jgi:ribonucleoside-diphosphate reductase alpha chain
VLGGTRLFETNALFEETAKTRGFYSAKLLEEIARTGSVQKIDGVPDDVKRLFVTALDIEPVWHIRMQAAFQKSTDNAVSKCLSKNQLLDTSGGILTIEKCGNANGTDKFGRALNGLKVRDSSGIQRGVLSHYSAGLVSASKITLWNGASMEGAMHTHRICTIDGWKTLGEITTKDLVKVKRRFIPLENTGSRILSPLGDPKTNANEIAVPTRMTPELAKWLGMIAADSCCNERGGRVGIVVGQRKKEAKTLFKALTLKLFNKHTRDVPDGRRPSTESIFITSRQLCRWVFALIGKSSRDRKVPEQVLEGSRAERMAFVEGLTLDGYYNEGHGLVVYEGRSQRLAYAVSEILRAEGKPRVTIHRKKDSYGITMGVCISNELQASFKAIEDHKNKEIIHKDQLVEIDPREVEKLKLPINDYRYSNLRSLKQTKRRYCWERVAKELGLTILSEVERVRSCEDAGLKEMYDIEVEGSHEYIVNGIISHNTVNLPNDAKVEDVREIYDLAWKLKCKGVTVFRYGSKPEQVLYIGEVKTKEGTFVSAQSEYAGGCPTLNCPFPA